MHNEVTLYKVTCPECAAVQYLFCGDNEDGYFYCNNELQVTKGKKITVEDCGFCCEKLHHMPDGSYTEVATIKIKDGKPEIIFEKEGAQ